MESNILSKPDLNILDVIERNSLLTKSILKEAEQNETPLKNKHLKVGLPDVEDIVKKNEIKEITNPVFFIRDGVPTSDGLLSNEIFGITREERSNIWGYIDLQGTYLHPLVYKLWGRMDSSIKNIVHGLKGYKLDSNGYIVEDLENGETGLDFLVKNISKIKIKESDSRDRHNNIEFIMSNKDRIFIKKMLVQPAFYRDVLSGKGKVEVGQLNKYYSSLLVATRSLKETQDYGFSLGDATKGRIEELLLSIYKCVTGTSGISEDGVGLSGKLGLLSMNSLAKTVDYGTRLVLSAPQLKVETLDDMMADTEHCALPLASAIVNFKPFVVFQIKRFFENELGGGTSMNIIYKGKEVTATPKDPMVTFSDDRIEKEIKKFVYGFSNRFEAVTATFILEDGKEVEAEPIFRGRSVSQSQLLNGNIEGESPLINRSLTWCDVLYMATEEAVSDKCVLITRYPIDSAYNQFPSIPRISTIENTEPVYVDGKLYRWYPRIRKEDIGSNTSNKFIDTLNICNLLLKGIGGDYE